jgi:hypothetical protein
VLNRIPILPCVLTTALIGLLSPALLAAAKGAGSLLLFPMFDNLRGQQTLITVTNTHADPLLGTVRLEYVYINRVGCQEFNRSRTLTPNDTLTVLTRVDNPNMAQGYVYVFAKSLTTGKAIKFDHLIGTMATLGLHDFELDPFVFRAGAALAEGAHTDLENEGIGDGLRDLDGLEYEPAPAEILVPRFFGQSAELESELILINLTGGAQFDALIDLLIYNDNEEVFSGQYSFRCWKRVKLMELSGAFSDSFLLSTNHAPNEVSTGSLPITCPETGWVRINGNLANSTHTVIPDPAILAARVDNALAGPLAHLPYSKGVQGNGSLLSHSITGQ